MSDNSVSVTGVVREACIESRSYKANIFSDSSFSGVGRVEGGGLEGNS